MNLKRLIEYANIYNAERLHTNFQEQEILNFLEWLHKQYCVEYTMPIATHQNTPEKLLK